MVTVVEKAETEKRENQIIHDVLFPYSMAELDHRLVNGNACNKKYAVSLYVNICFHHAKCLQNCDNIFFYWHSFTSAQLQNS